MFNVKARSAIEYAKSFIGVPYKWGGETPMAGYDCSGFVQEILSSVGLDPVGDQTAQALADYYVSFGKVVEKPKAGCLVFFGQARIKITHVGFMINNFQMIEAGGGGRQVVDKQSAIDHRAFIRVRPYTYRSDLIYLIDPF